MALRSTLLKPISNYVANQIRKEALQAEKHQDTIRESLIQLASNTAFGVNHQFKSIKNYDDFKSHIPIADYEDFKPYIERIIQGESNVLWKGKPLYFAKTSGTTSGVKYIPLTKESMPNHFGSARNAVFCYLAESKNYRVMDGKMIFLSGSPEMDKKGEILTGRLSGIVNHHIPAIFRTNQMPSYQTNCMDDWETKVEAITNETKNKNMSLISGIPPWVEMYFDKLKQHTGKKFIKDIFPNFSLYVHGGVNYEPYRNKILNSIGKRIDTIDTYPASEGFIAYQDTMHQQGMLLNTNSGIFFEFIPTNEINNKTPTRLSLRDIELHVNYAIILNTNAGLWAYNIGDTIKFVSKNPYRIIVTGRIKHYISAFGEHVIAEEVDYAMNQAMDKFGFSVVEYTVAPNITPENAEKPYHHWLIEFDSVPDDLKQVALFLNDCMRQKNVYYNDLIEGNILQNAKITILKKGAFIEYMKQQGKLGGQNKVPRLSNNSDIANDLMQYKM